MSYHSFKITSNILDLFPENTRFVLVTVPKFNNLHDIYATRDKKGYLVLTDVNISNLSIYTGYYAWLPKLKTLSSEDCAQYDMPYNIDHNISLSFTVKRNIMLGKKIQGASYITVSKSYCKDHVCVMNCTKKLMGDYGTCIKMEYRLPDSLEMKYSKTLEEIIGIDNCFVFITCQV